jgi:hypothetical protein
LQQKLIYEKEAKTPYQRVLESPYVDDELNARLREKNAALNVITLQRRLDAALENLDRFVQHSPGSPDCQPKPHG